MREGSSSRRERCSSYRERFSKLRERTSNLRERCSSRRERCSLRRMTLPVAPVAVAADHCPISAKEKRNLDSIFVISYEAFIVRDVHLIESKSGRDFEFISIHL